MEWTLNLAEATDYDTVYELVSEFHATENIQLASSVRASAVRALLGNDILGNIWLINGDGACAGYIALRVAAALLSNRLYSLLRGAASRRCIWKLSAGRRTRVALYASCGLIAREDYVLMSADPPSAD